MSLYGRKGRQSIHYWKGRHFEVEPDDPRAAGVCERCGFRFNLENMQWQYDYRGGVSPVNTRILVCGRPSCLDAPNPQRSPVILSPDPMPADNAREESYVVDETSWLATESEDIYTALDGDQYLSNIGDNGSVAFLETDLSVPGGDVSVMYLDIFDGDPLGSGRSVLAQITGSATRVDVAADLTTLAGVATNAAQIVITPAAETTVNTNYIGFYSASSSGALLISGPMNVSGNMVTQGNPVAFDARGIRIELT